MLINIDVKGLEVVAAAYLSQDKVLMEELNTGVDIHAANMNKFGLPTRLIAKVLKFRIIYGGTSFANDPDFASVSTSKEYWAKAIEAYYDKYTGIKAWHTKLVQTATTTGQIISPTGRIFTYKPKEGKYGLEWPVTTIKNYIVQGLGADLVMIARISLFNRMKKLNLKSKLISTVHDSIVIDCPEEEWEQVAIVALSCIQDVPNNFERLFKTPFNLSLNAEVLYGKNMSEMIEWKP